MGLRPKPKRKAPFGGKTVVFGMVERDGRVRTMVVPEATAKELGPLLTGYIDTENATLMTDGHSAYRLIRNHLPHNVINHELTYVDGDTHTQNIEGYWALLKRGIVGTFHHVSRHRLPMYLGEFEYRFNHRDQTDADRFENLLSQTQGRLRWNFRQ